MQNQHPILLVEDNPDDQILTLRALKNNNIANDVVVAQDGEEALDFVFQRGKYARNSPDFLPHFILLDIKLPKVDGLEVLRQIRSSDKAKHLPIVMLTSSREQQDMIESYNLGANSYIRKPVDFQQFSNTVKQLGFYWLVLNELPQ